jgi:hypothetical protein
MSAFARLRRDADAVTTTEGISSTAAAMWVMVVQALAMAAHVPIELRQALVAASARWYTRDCDPPRLEEWRVASWRFLQAKHGNSTTVIDLSDVAVRALICVLWDDEPSGEDADMSLDYLGSLLDGHAETLNSNGGGV